MDCRKLLVEFFEFVKLDKGDLIRTHWKMPSSRFCWLLSTAPLTSTYLICSRNFSNRAKQLWLRVLFTVWIVIMQQKAIYSYLQQIAMTIIKIIYSYLHFIFVYFLFLYPTNFYLIQLASLSINIQQVFNKYLTKYPTKYPTSIQLVSNYYPTILL